MAGFGDIGQILFRVFVLFGMALIVVRLMGNRTVGQLSPFDFVIMVGIGDIIITASMDKSATILSGVEGLTALLVLQQVLSYLSLKSVLLRKWFEGTPVTLIQDGKIIRENLAQTQFNYDDLRQELHKQGLDMTRLHTIKLARLESCGHFSIVKMPEEEPLPKCDLENYMKDIFDNPLSPQGVQWTKIEKLMANVEGLMEQLKQQRGPSIKINQPEGTEIKEMH
jgi:uncharacterized membrane protein YcaP (DUF421 family)